MSSADKIKKNELVWLFAAFAIPLLWLAVLRFFTVTSGENSLDAFYHARIALEGPRVFAADSFPALAFSTWTDAFADKELLYHLSLWLIFSVERIFGFIPDAPFNFEALIYVALALAAFVFAAKSLGASPRTVFVCALIFALASPNFTYRLLMLRPHVVSIAFLLVVCGVAGSEHFSFRARLITLSSLSLLYSLTYSNPHFICVVILLFAMFRFLRDGRRELLIPLVSAVLVFAGLLLHPQFPNSLAIWKTQSVDAVLFPMDSASLIPKPGEMSPPAFAWQRNVMFFYILASCVLFMLVRLVERRGFRAVPRAYFPLALIGFSMTCGIFAAMRSIEYAVPFTTLLFALLFDEFSHDEKGFFKYRLGNWRSFAVLLFVALSLGAWSSYMFYTETHSRQYLPIRSMSAWMRSRLPAGTRVVNINWSDFTRLYYYTPEYEYVWGMDPVFSYAKDRRVTLMMSELLYARTHRVSAREASGLTGAKYAVLLGDFTNETAAYKIRHMGRDYSKCLVFKGEGIIFELKK